MEPAGSIDSNNDITDGCEKKQGLGNQLESLISSSNKVPAIRLRANSQMLELEHNYRRSTVWEEPTTTNWCNSVYVLYYKSPTTVGLFVLGRYKWKTKKAWRNQALGDFEFAFWKEKRTRKKERKKELQIVRRPSLLANQTIKATEETRRRRSGSNSISWISFDFASASQPSSSLSSSRSFFWKSFARLFFSPLHVFSVLDGDRQTRIKMSLNICLFWKFSHRRMRS